MSEALVKKRYKKIPAEARVRAFAIFKESNGLASPVDIARQLASEGYGDIGRENVSAWKKTQKWGKKEVTAQTLALGEDLRRATVIRASLDLDGVEHASCRLVTAMNRLADHVEAEIPHIKLRTAEDLERAVRSMRELAHAHFTVAKGAQDLRLLRASTNFTEPNGAKNGEIIPPDREEDPVSEQERVISNFDLH